MLFHLQQPDGSNLVCYCGSDLFEMKQNKLPWCAIVECSGCQYQFLGTKPETRMQAWLN